MHVQRPIRLRGGATRNAAPATVAAGLLLFEAATFIVAAAIHGGALGDAHTHRAAATAETVIAIVLLTAFGLAWTPQPWPLRFAVLAQAFALAGVLVGLFTIAIGVGPQSVLDAAYHVVILAVLAAGLAICRPPRVRARRRLAD